MGEGVRVGDTGLGVGVQVGEVGLGDGVGVTGANVTLDGRSVGTTGTLHLTVAVSKIKVTMLRRRRLGRRGFIMHSPFTSRLPVQSNPPC